MTVTTLIIIFMLVGIPILWSAIWWLWLISFVVFSQNLSEDFDFFRDTSVFTKIICFPMWITMSIATDSGELPVGSWFTFALTAGLYSYFKIWRGILRLFAFVGCIVILIVFTLLRSIVNWTSGADIYKSLLFSAVSLIAGFLDPLKLEEIESGHNNALFDLQSQIDTLRQSEYNLYMQVQSRDTLLAQKTRMLDLMRDSGLSMADIERQLASNSHFPQTGAYLRSDNQLPPESNIHSMQPYNPPLQTSIPQAYQPTSQVPVSQVPVPQTPLSDPYHGNGGYQPSPQPPQPPQPQQPLPQHQPSQPQSGWSSLGDSNSWLSQQETEASSDRFTW